MLGTYTSIVHMTQTGFFSTKTVYLAHLYYGIYEIGKNKNSNLMFQTFKNEILKQIKFP